MKNKYKWIFAMGFLSVILFFSQIFTQEASEEITISGTIEAKKFDDSGNVKQIALCVKIQIDEDDYDFVSYIIIINKKGKELYSFIGKEVLITGTLITKDGNKVITVKEYKVIESKKDVENDVSHLNMKNLYKYYSF